VSTMNRKRQRPQLRRANELLTELSTTAVRLTGVVDDSRANRLIRPDEEDPEPLRRSVWLGLGPSVRKDVGVRVSPLAPRSELGFRATAADAH
jgi:hypothetical protein